MLTDQGVPGPLQQDEDERMSTRVSKTVLVREALREVGEAPAQELTALIEQRHGVKINPKIIPLLRASVRELEHLEKVREAAKAAVQKALAEQPPARKARTGDAGRGKPDPIPSQSPPG